MTTHAKATYVADSDFTLYVGDVRDVLRGLPDESVHCVVTSPPYWGLRDYSVNGQLGLEPTPEEYVANMVEVFREVRRVLRRDGTCWLNIGDGYNANVGAGFNANARIGHQDTRVPSGLKPKNLLGMPWRLAFALQADGWYLRADIIWAKPNPMPESVTDRPTKAHEYVFQLTRSGDPTYWTHDVDSRPGVRSRPAPDYWWVDLEGKLPPSREQVEGWKRRNAWRGHDYFFDQEAVREAYEGDPEYRYGRVGAYQNRAINGVGDGTTPTSIRGPDGRHKTTVKGSDGSIQHRDGERWPNGGRNIRSVWEIATQPYAQAHFATFPEALVERCLLAGTSERGCCPECGAPWERETSTEYDAKGRTTNGPRSLEQRHETAGFGQRLEKHVETTGWKATCGCGPAGHRYNFETDPCTVLDPFMGSGTTALVARNLGRKSIGIELNEEYAQLAATRLQQLSLLA